MNTLDVSLVIPIRDEAAAIPSLADEVDAALSGAGLAYEVIWVDDGSIDASVDRLRSLPAPHRLIRLDGNHGQSVALLAGFRAAKAEWIATLDGDGQNDPADLPRQLAHLRQYGADCCNGVRERRADPWLRRIAGRIGNRARALITGDAGVTDVGCATRVLRRRYALYLPAFNGMHRFLPTLVRIQGGSVTEIPVNHRPRRGGVSKYGVVDRLLRGLRDCLGVRWLRARLRPWSIIEDSARLPIAASSPSVRASGDEAPAEPVLAAIRGA